MEFDREPTKVSRIIAIYIRIRYIIKYVLTFRTITQIKYPVFIIGCGHSGTSILLSILGMFFIVVGVTLVNIYSSKTI